MNHIVFQTKQGEPRVMFFDMLLLLDAPIMEQEMTLAQCVAPYVPQGAPFFCCHNEEITTEEDPNADYLESWDLDWDLADGVGTGEKAISLDDLDEEINAITD